MLTVFAVEKTEPQKPKQKEINEKIIKTLSERGEQGSRDVLELAAAGRPGESAASTASV